MEGGESWDARNHMEGSALRKLLGMAEGMWMWTCRLMEAGVLSSLLLAQETSTGQSLASLTLHFLLCKMKLILHQRFRIRIK